MIASWIKRGWGRMFFVTICIFYSIGITFYTFYKGLYSQSCGFSCSHVWLWELDHKEGWAQKNWCFQIVVLEKTLESPWTARRSNQSILKEINSDYSLESLMWKLKLQFFGHLMQRNGIIGKDTNAGKDWLQKRKGWQMMRLLDSIAD